MPRRSKSSVPSGHVGEARAVKHSQKSHVNAPRVFCFLLWPRPLRRVREAWVCVLAEMRGRGGRGRGGVWRGWILNQRSAPVTPSGVSPSGHVPKIATGAVSSAKPPASGLQPVCECEISMGVFGHLPIRVFPPPPPPPPASSHFFPLFQCNWQMSLHF